MLKKLFVNFIVFVYIFELCVGNLVFSNTVFAKGNIIKTNVNLIIVDKDIYEGLKSNLQTYTSIIQKNNPNTKAIVLPINKTIGSIAIRKIIENMYFEGQESTPTKLEGITLIGDIPIPVINNDGYIYPSVYPYTDMEKPKYIYNTGDKYWILNTAPYDTQPEIRHSIIKFDNQSDYSNYFVKLFKYYQKPELFASPSVWYDDFIMNKKLFINDIYKFYVSKLIFAEDLNYNRYTSTLIDLIQVMTNTFSYQNLSNSIPKAYNGTNPEAQNYSNEQNNTLGSFAKIGGGFFDIMRKILSFLGSSSNSNDINSSSSLGSSPGITAQSSQNAPTMFLSKVANAYLKNYLDLFGSDYINTIKNNLDFGGRYGEKSKQGIVNGSILAINTNDQNSVDIIRLFNDKLEKAIDTQIYKEKYYIKTPILQNIYYTKNRVVGKTITTKYFTNNYFGFNVSKLRTAEDMSLWRGTYNNIIAVSGLKNYNYSDKKNYISSDINLNVKNMSVGAALGFLAREVEANKGYNAMAMEDEVQKINDTNQQYCRKNEKGELEEYTENVRQFFSPLNLQLTSNSTLKLILSSGSKYSKPNLIYSLESDKLMGGPILDIGGSKLTSGDRKLGITISNNEYGSYYVGDGESAEETSFKNYNAPSADQDTNEDEDNLKSLFCNLLSHCADGSITSLGNGDFDCAKDGESFTISYADLQHGDANTCESDADITINGETFKISQLSDAYSSDYESETDTYNPDVNKSTELKQTWKSYSGLSDSYMIYKGFSYPVLEFFNNNNLLGDKIVNYCLARQDKLRINEKYVDIYDIPKSINEKLKFTKDIDIEAQEMQEIFKKNNIALSFIPLSFLSKKTKSFYYFYNLGVNIDTINKYPYGTPQQAMDYIYKSLWPKILKYYGEQGLSVGIVKGSKYALEFRDTYIREAIWVKPQGKKINKYINYKLVDSRFYHKSPTYDQIYGYDIVIEQPNLESQIRDIKNGNRTRYELTQTASLTFVIANELFTLPGLSTTEHGTIAKKIWRRIIHNPDITINGPLYEWNGVSDIIVVKSGVQLRIHGKKLTFDKDVKFKKYDDLGVIKYRPMNESGDFISLGRAGGINESTNERPIDTPRRINFQGIGGTLTEIVYPDLWQVEVYDSNGKLKNIDQIKVAIKDYLNKKLQKYNLDLKGQLDKRGIFYSSLPAGIRTTIKKVDPYSVPDRTYSLFPNNFFETSLTDSKMNLLSDDSINIIAYNLYYQNIMWQSQTFNGKLIEDLTQKYKIADISAKIKYLNERYLSYDRLKISGTNNDLLSNNKILGDTIYPVWNQTGYELGYINSDGADYYSTDVPNPILKTIITDKENTNKTQKPQLNQADQECGIESNGSVFITKRPKAFSCWLKNLKNYSFKPKITFNNQTGFKQFGEDWKNVLSDLTGTMNQYADSWRMVGKSSQNLKLIAQKTEKEKTNIFWLSNNLSIIQNSFYALDDTTKDNKQKTVQISLYSNLASGIKVGEPKFDLYIYTTGSNCLSYNSVNLCQKESKIGTFDIYKISNSGNIINLNLVKNTIGYMGISYKVCLPNSDVCQYVDRDILIMPGNPYKTTIYTPMGNYSLPTTLRIVKGSNLPFKIISQDKYNNQIDISSSDYYFASNFGLLDYQGQKYSGFSTNDWNSLDLIYDSSNIIGSQDIFGIYNVTGFVNDKSSLNNNQKITFSFENPNINTDKTNIIYKLPNTSQEISPSVNSMNLQVQNTVYPDKIPYVDVTINDGKIRASAKIYSANNAFVPGFVEKKTISGVNINSFEKIIPDSDIIITGTKRIYIYPNMIAGSDQLVIQIGNYKKSININFKPADPAKVIINLPFKETTVGKTVNVKYIVTDIWGNKADKSVDLVVGLFGSILSPTIKANSTGEFKNVIGEISHTFSTKSPGGNSTFYAYINDSGKYSTKYTPDYQNLLVNNAARPKEKLDIMYLNLFGNDWGNLWGNNSANKGLHTTLFSKSPKLLNITTQLQNPTKINRSIAYITQSLQLGSPINANIYISKQGKYFGIQADNNDNFIPLFSSINFDVKIVEDIINIPSDSLKGKPTIYIIKKKNNLTSMSTVGSSLLVDGAIFDFGRYNNIYIQSSNEVIGDYNIHKFYYNKNVIADIVIVGNLTQAISSQDISDLKNIYQPQNIDVYQSFGLDTNVGGLQVVKTNDNLGINKTEDSVIENSDNHLLSVGFGGRFQNISNFANGQTVGKATLPGASEFMVNFGDPYVTRVAKSAPVDDINMKNRDGGQGMNIYATNDDEIIDVKPFSLDGDGDKELLVVNNKGTVKLLKNFGGKDNRKDYGNIINISHGIDKMRVGDTNSDKYQDIIIQTNSNKLRVYRNIDGKIDVDGNPICLDIDGGPDNIKNIFNMEVFDINGDGNLDIAINDFKNNVKIFWGGRSALGDNYISNYATGCDVGWKNRQSSNVSMLDGFKLRIEKGVNILDSSMIHWKGMPNSQQAISTTYDGYTDLEKAKNDSYYEGETVGGTTQIAGFRTLNPRDPNATTQYKNDVDINKDNRKDHMKKNSDVQKIAIPESLMQTGLSGKLVKMSVDYMPSYEYGSPYDYINYVDRKTIDATDPISITKTYEDLNGAYIENGDDVMIKVTFISKKDLVYTFLDAENGPWDILLDTGGNISGWKIDGLNSDYQLNINDSNFRIILDNIKLSAGQTASYSYIVKYNATNAKLANMELNTKYYSGKLEFAGYKSANSQNVISLVPVDSCKKYSFDYAFNIDKTYAKSQKDLRKAIDALKNKELSGYQTNLNNLINSGMDLDNTLVSQVTSGYNPYSIKQQLQETWNQNPGYSKRANLIEKIADNQSIYKNFDLNKIIPIPSRVANFMNFDLNKFSNKLCNGLKIGNGDGSWGLPLPGSMAFLSPGIQNFMGCELPIYGGNSYDKGIPIFAAPTNATPFIRPPTPNGAGGWLPGSSTSMIRIFISPTTTAGLGIAICIGPEGVGKRIVKPFRDVAGNCIVLAGTLGAKKTPAPPANSGLNITPDYASNLIQDSCGVTTNRPLSPFVLTVGGNDIVGNIAAQSSNKDLGGLANKFLTEVNLGGTNYKFANTQTISLDQFIETSTININEPIKVEPKIKNDKNKNTGIVACITTNFLNPQIEYMKNNLTKFGVNVYLPEFSSVFGKQDESFKYLSNNNNSRVNITGGDIIKDGKKYASDTMSTVPNLSSITQGLKDNAKSKFGSGSVSGSNTIQKALNVLSTNNIQKINDSTSDPFEELKNWMDKSFNTQISTRNIYIDVPLVSSDNILEAKSYFDNWIATNDSTINDYKNVIKDINENCKTKYGGDAEKCANRVKELTNIITNYQNVKGSIKQNIRTLELYSELPLQIYNFIKIQDQYIVDILNAYNNTIGYLSNWLNKNINTITTYLETFTTMVAAIKSRQVLINIGVNFKNKCGSCTVDNYSYYSCSFKGFCPKFPIFKIPPFKLPRITIDFSKINLGANILLPKYIFRPKTIDVSSFLKLPNLPNLGPNSMGVTVMLPKIPVIPSPPQLNSIQLPSIIPQIEWNLPTLPPAPRIPKIAPELSVAIDVVDFVSQIYCLIKKGLPLVGEKGVKNKIEQLTQRTYDSNLFDFPSIKYPAGMLDLTNLGSSVGSQNSSYDFKIESVIDFQATFGGVYNLFDNLAQNINSKTSVAIKTVNNTQNNIQNDIGNQLQKIQTKEENIRSKNPVKSTVKVDLTYNTIYNNDVEETDTYINIRNNLSSERNYIKQKLQNEYYGEQNIGLIDSLLLTLNHKSSVKMSSELDDTVSQVNDIVKDHIKDSDKLKNEILYNYDNWIKTLSADNLVNDNTILLDKTDKVFEADKYTYDLIKNTENPNITYLKINKTLVDGYKYVLENKSSETYLDEYSIKNIKNESIALSNNIDAAIQIIENNNSINSKTSYDGIKLAEEDPMINQLDNSNQGINNTNTNTTTTNSSANGLMNTNGKTINAIATDNNKSIDETNYIAGLFVKGVKNYYNIIDSQELSNKIIDKFSKDINGDNREDIILWTNKNIYIKYNDQSIQNVINSKYTNYYEAPTINNIGDLSKMQNGFITIGSILGLLGGEKYKTWSSDMGVYNFVAQGQEYDNISYKWSNDKIRSSSGGGYLFRYTDDIQDYGKENYYTNWKYVLFVPNYVDSSGYKNTQINYDVGGQIKSENISNLISKNQLTIKTYNFINDNLSNTINNPDRKWFYAQISKTKLIGDTWIKGSSRTSQRNGGPQIINDKIGPTIKLPTLTGSNDGPGNNGSGTNGTGNGGGGEEGGGGSCQANTGNNTINLLYNNSITDTGASFSLNISDQYDISIKNNANKTVKSYNYRAEKTGYNCMDSLTTFMDSGKIYINGIKCVNQSQNTIYVDVVYDDGSKETIKICINFDNTDSCIGGICPCEGSNCPNNPNNSPELGVGLQFIRSKTNKLISIGYQHNGNILTNYTLRGQWEDDVGFAGYKRYIQLEGDQKLDPLIVTSGYSTDPNINITGIYSNKISSLVYVLEGSDVAGNITRVKALVSLGIPNIDITNIYNKDSLTAIQTEVSSQMDDASIVYEKNSNGDITQLVSSDNKHKYNLGIEQTEIDGGLFKFENGYKLYDSSGAIIAMLYDNGYIYMINSNYKIITDMSTNIPVVQISDKSNNILFDISFESKTLKSVISNSLTYQVVRLPRNYTVPNFAGGYCFSTNNAPSGCKVFFSLDGQVGFSSETNNYEFDYSFIEGSVNYQIYQSGNKVGNYSIEVNIK